MEKKINKIYNEFSNREKNVLRQKRKTNVNREILLEFTAGSSSRKKKYKTGSVYFTLIICRETIKK